MQSIRTYAAAVAAAGVLAGAVTVAASPAYGVIDPSRPSVSVKDLTGGSFESFAIVSTSLTLSPGQDFGEWQVTAGDINLTRGRWESADGSQSVDLSGNMPGAISQTFPTNPGETYVVTYSIAGNPESDNPALRTGAVKVNGHNVQSFSFDVTGRTAQNMGWTGKSLTFQATSTATTLTFASTTDSAYGPAIDNVQVKGCDGACGT